MEAEAAAGSGSTAEPFLEPVKGRPGSDPAATEAKRNTRPGSDPAAAEAKRSTRPALDENASPVAGRRFTRTS